MKPVLIDTGCIVALLDRSETNHLRCAETVLALKAPLITCEAVIAETCYLLRNLRGAPDAVLENIRKGVFLLPYRLEDHCQAVQRLMRKYSDIPMDLADACLVDLAATYRTGAILTLDSYFGVYRWARSRPFELLLGQID